MRKGKELPRLQLKEDPGVTLQEVEAYLHLDEPDTFLSEAEEMDLWVMVLDVWRSLKGTLRQTNVPPRLLLQCVAIRYYQPRAHKNK